VRIVIQDEVLRVTNADGSLTSRYRAVTSSEFRTDQPPNGPGIHQPSDLDGGQWYTKVKYIDNVTGAVVLVDEAEGEPWSLSRPIPDPNYASIAPGFRWTGNGNELISDDEHNSWSLAPIVFDLADLGLSQAFGPSVSFDVDGIAPAEQVEWLRPGFGLLALDRDGDGRVSSGAEISFVQDKAGAKTDLEGLAAYDGNGDFLLSAADERFAQFRIWQDLNSNGVSESGELRSLSEMGIVSIGLVGTPTGQTLSNVWGNVILNTASFKRSDGSVGAIGDAVLRPAERDGVVAFREALAIGKGRLGRDLHALEASAQTLLDRGAPVSASIPAFAPDAEARNLLAALRLGLDKGSMLDQLRSIRREQGEMVDPFGSYDRDGRRLWTAPEPLGYSGLESVARPGDDEPHVAHMIQQMASFAPRAGEAVAADRREGSAAPYDYFA
jgi:hypothetical protein